MAVNIEDIAIYIVYNKKALPSCERILQAPLKVLLATGLYSVIQFQYFIL